MAVGLDDFAMRHNDAIEWPSKHAFNRLAKSVLIS